MNLDQTTVTWIMCAGAFIFGLFMGVGLTSLVCAAKLADKDFNDINSAGR